MLKNIINNKFKRIFLISLVGIIICLFSYIVFIYNQYITNTRELQSWQQDISELEWTFIKSIIYEDYLAATNQANLIADRITNRISKHYPDLNQLKLEFEHPEDYPYPEYIKIMESTIKDQYLFGIENDDNDIFICNKYGIKIIVPQFI